MNDDIERTLRDSLDRHAAGALTPGGEIDDVYRRVHELSARRRSLAVIASIAALMGGVIGFALFAAGGGSKDEVALDAATAPPDMPSTTMTIPLSGSGWSCAGYLGSDGYRTYYSECFQTSWSNGPTAFCATTTVVLTIPATTIPITTIPTDANANANETVDSNACDVAPPVYEPQCFVNMTTTIPAMSTTTSIEAAIGSAPSPQNATAEAVACSTYASAQAGSVPTTWPVTVPDGIASPLEQTYIVVAGDSLTSIARTYRIEVDALVMYNDWPEGINHPLFVGDVVLIPPGAAIP